MNSPHPESSVIRDESTGRHVAAAASIRFPAPLALAFGTYQPARYLRPSGVHLPSIRLHRRDTARQDGSHGRPRQRVLWALHPAAARHRVTSADSAEEGDASSEASSLPCEKMARSSNLSTRPLSTRPFRYCRYRTVLRQRWTARILTRAFLSLHAPLHSAIPGRPPALI